MRLLSVSCWVLGLFLGLHSTAALADFSDTPPKTKARIVQSYPEETTLKTPGVAETLPAWIWMIGRSKHTIDIAQMYVSSIPGEGIERVIDALQRAAKR